MNIQNEIGDGTSSENLKIWEQQQAESGQVELVTAVVSEIAVAE